MNLNSSMLARGRTRLILAGGVVPLLFAGTFFAVNAAHAQTGNAPVESAITATSTDTTGTTESVGWTTDTPSTSDVVYGTTTPYSNSSGFDINLSTSHAVTLTGLMPDTTYHYAVLSDNGFGTTVSPDATFTTLAVSTTTTATSTAFLSLNEYSGLAGASITATGSDFAANEPVTVDFDGTTYATTTDVNGDFTQAVTVPQVASGSITITATGRTSGLTASNSFFVEPAVTTQSALITLSAYSGLPGAVITVDGTGFAADETVHLDFGSASTTAAADVNGAFSASFTVPQVASGDLGVTAMGETSGSVADATFFVEAPTTTPPVTVVLPGADATMDPQGPVRAGTTVDFGGRNWGIEEPVQVTTDGMVVAMAHADGGGNFTTGSLPVADAPNTTQVYTFTGLDSGITRSLTLTITP